MASHHLCASINSRTISDEFYLSPANWCGDLARTNSDSKFRSLNCKLQTNAPMKTFFETASMQNHPLRAVSDFLNQEAASEKAQKYEEMRFVGYVLDIGYDSITIITSDPFKENVGGIPRNSLLIM